MSIKPSDILQEFKKPELLELCTELGIEYQIQAMSRDIIKSILSDIDTNGIPEDPNDPEQCSELLFSFLAFIKYIDENGNVIEEVVDEIPNVTQKVEIPVEVTLPPCWGFEDDADPSCKKCKLQDQCRIQRNNTRPECFGKLFSSAEEDCNACLVASYCKVEYNRIQKLLA